MDNISSRLSFIKELSKDTDIDSILYSCDSPTSPREFTKKTHKFRKIIKQFGGKLTYIKSGSSGHTFKGIIQSDQDHCHLPVVCDHPSNYGTADCAGGPSYQSNARSSAAFFFYNLHFSSSQFHSLIADRLFVQVDLPMGRLLKTSRHH